MRWLLLLLLLLLHVEAREIYFAPLPIQPNDRLIGSYMPLVEYLKKKTRLNITLVYEEDYTELLEKFKAGKIHMFTSGPLPYYTLRKVYPYAKAIAYFKEEDSSISYRCVLIAPPDGPSTLKEVKGPIALTQKLSTCGYFSASIMLSKAGKDIENMQYTFFDTHTEVAEAVLKGTHQVGSLKENIALKYKGYGIKVLAVSPHWPAHSLVVNTKVLSRDEIEKIRKALIEISPEERKEFTSFTHGFSEAREEDFQVIKPYEKHIPRIP